MSTAINLSAYPLPQNLLATTPPPRCQTFPAAPRYFQGPGVIGAPRPTQAPRGPTPTKRGKTPEAQNPQPPSKKKTRPHRAQPLQVCHWQRRPAVFPHHGPHKVYGVRPLWLLICFFHAQPHHHQLTTSNSSSSAVAATRLRRRRPWQTICRRRGKRPSR